MIHEPSFNFGYQNRGGVPWVGPSFYEHIVSFLIAKLSILLPFSRGRCLVETAKMPTGGKQATWGQTSRLQGTINKSMEKYFGQDTKVPCADWIRKNDDPSLWRDKEGVRTTKNTSIRKGKKWVPKSSTHCPAHFVYSDHCFLRPWIILNKKWIPKYSGGFMGGFKKTSVTYSKFHTFWLLKESLIELVLIKLVEP